MPWRAILLIWPARLFTWWWRAYVAVLAFVFMVTATVTALSLLLLAWGIRFGW